MGQWLSVPFIIAAFVLIWYAMSRPEVKPAAAKAQPTAPVAKSNKPKTKKKKW
jgi:prolipoprotein diacylglyceryltransferase